MRSHGKSTLVWYARFFQRARVIPINELFNENVVRTMKCIGKMTSNLTGGRPQSSKDVCAGNRQLFSAVQREQPNSNIPPSPLSKNQASCLAAQMFPLLSFGTVSREACISTNGGTHSSNSLWVFNLIQHGFDIFLATHITLNYVWGKSHHMQRSLTNTTITHNKPWCIMGSLWLLNWKTFEFKAFLRESKKGLSAF